MERNSSGIQFSKRMLQTIRLYQAVRYDGKQRDFPICATEKPWLGRGYYFWEHEIENAHHWGKRHYGGQYCIYQSSYQNTEEGLDLVDNYEQREQLANYIKQIEARIDKSISLEQIIELLRKHTSKRIHYIRIDTGSFFQDERTQLPVPNKRPLPWLFTKRLVQVCFPYFPCQEIGLTDYRIYEEPSTSFFG